MKTLLLSIMASCLFSICGVALAETVVTTTTDEYGVPITVEQDTYTVTPPAYYYYSGHRCYTKQRSDLSVNFLGLHAGVGGSGSDVYCYPYP